MCHSEPEGGIRFRLPYVRKTPERKMSDVAIIRFETFHEGWDYRERLDATLIHYRTWQKQNKL